jgi:hypothetical protein
MIAVIWLITTTVKHTALVNVREHLPLSSVHATTPSRTASISWRLSVVTLAKILMSSAKYQQGRRILYCRVLASLLYSAEPETELWMTHDKTAQVVE